MTDYTNKIALTGVVTSFVSFMTFLKLGSYKTTKLLNTYFDVDLMMPTHKKTNALLKSVSSNYDDVRNLIHVHGEKLLNSQDHFGTSALHLAVKYGDVKMIGILLSYPDINVNLEAYREYKEDDSLRGYSPLDFAIKYHQPIEIVQQLLEAGATTRDPENLFDMLMDVDYQKLGIEEKDENIFFLDFMLPILELLVNKIPEIAYCKQGPCAIQFMEMMAHLDMVEDKIALQKMIDMLIQHDTNHYIDRYIAAKDFTHAFPSDNDYASVNAISSYLVPAEGQFRLFSLKAFHQSVIDYQDNIVLNQRDNLKQTIFSQLNATYHLAEQAYLNKGMYESSENLFRQYEQGDTLLLHTGWTGHAVDVILDKALGLYVVANAGDRYSTLSSGVKAYYYDKSITADNIYSLLNNENQYDLEYEAYYNFELVESPAFSKAFPDQVYGNCALNSILLANWSLTYINLYKNLGSHMVAREMADTWHEDMVEHHKTLAIKNYLTEPYFIEDKPIYDALTKYETKLDHVEKVEQTRLMLDYLTSAEHLADFKDFYKTYPKDFSADLVQFIQENGYGDKLQDAKVSPLYYQPIGDYFYPPSPQHTEAFA